MCLNHDGKFYKNVKLLELLSLKSNMKLTSD